VLMQPKIWPLL